ncbi:hypothetical protein QVH35_09945 [Candidatus Nitrosotenuis chungbukensis]|uniref:hypothetical protein n=1 Tax=Candidatus Nitrosotenuis chungbukensis TaxID=1353246 RepID=UPI002670DCCA|nr:hypothetical protein [Candidatus Nitrosotenuis chungbukensis]WKT57644.1 hypothetical protein QVH35_09945 [Candidatus Nitrosotenuis chungbukensis]
MLVTVPDAYAATIQWVGSPFSLNVGTADPSGLGSTQVVVRVTDTAGLGTVQVRITSSVDSVGIVLTLDEVSPGVYENTNLALMNGNDVISLSDTATITISDTPGLGTINGDSSIVILSDSDSFGIVPIFTETGSNTGTYTAQISFGATTDEPTNRLAATAGDFITVDDTTAGRRANGMIAPNPSPSLFKGAISAEVGQSVTAEYTGLAPVSFTVSAYPGPGRGGGGLVAPSLVVDAIAIASASSSSGSGCKGDCTPPTLGVDDTYQRLVDAGFSYNDHPVDVMLFYTHYPLVTSTVGRENKAVLRIYENSGISNIKHVELAFGLGKGQILDESKASISLDTTDDGEKVVSTYDPENVLQDIRVETTTSKCNPFTFAECQVVTIYHTFRAPLDFNIVATDVWDFDNNAWQNYYNDGIEITGESLNPPREHVGIYKGNQIHIVETGMNTAVDGDGNTWTFNKEWVMDYKPAGKIDSITSHGYDRHNDMFSIYKESQELLAQFMLEKILAGKEIHSELTERPQDTIFNYVSRQDNKELQIDKTFESIRAEEILKKCCIHTIED